MGPGGLVVAGPHGAHALRTGEKGAGEDEGAFRRGRVTVQKGVVSGIDES